MTAVTFTRCPHCDTTVMTHDTPVNRLVHLEDGSHVWRPWNPAGEAPRPDHRTVSMWNDIRAVLNNIHQIEFYLGYLPEKPMHGWDAEVVRLQLADARATLGALANALADGAGS